VRRQPVAQLREEVDPVMREELLHDDDAPVHAASGATTER
jgi:hypothetical protein